MALRPLLCIWMRKNILTKKKVEFFSCFPKQNKNNLLPTPLLGDQAGTEWSSAACITGAHARTLCFVSWSCVTKLLEIAHLVFIHGPSHARTHLRIEHGRAGESGDDLIILPAMPMAKACHVISLDYRIFLRIFIHISLNLFSLSWLEFRRRQVLQIRPR